MKLDTANALLAIADHPMYDLALQLRAGLPDCDPLAGFAFGKDFFFSDDYDAPRGYVTLYCIESDDEEAGLCVHVSAAWRRSGDARNTAYHAGFGSQTDALETCLEELIGSDYKLHHY